MARSLGSQVDQCRVKGSFSYWETMTECEGMNRFHIRRTLYPSRLILLTNTLTTASTNHIAHSTTSTALGSDIGYRTPVRNVSSAGSLFPVVSRHLWGSARKSELVGTENYVAIQGLQSPSGATDCSFFQPGKYSIKHDIATGLSRLEVVSQAPGGSPCHISASDSKATDIAHFVVTQLSLPGTAHLHSLAAGSEAVLEVIENGGFTIRPGPAREEYRIEGTGAKSRLSQCLRTNT
jgi:hypothetical protein